MTWVRAPWLRSGPALFVWSFLGMVVWVQGIAGVPAANRPELARSLREPDEAVAEGPERSARAAEPPSTTTTTAPPPTSTTTPPTTAPPPSTTTAPAPPPERAARTFGEGLFVIGEDIEPGVYVSSGELCFWERLSGTGGAADELIATDSTTGQSLVEIGAGDRAFNSSGCAPWAPLGEPAPVATFGEGTFAVGSQFEPGSYRSSGAGSCYWERLSGLGGEFEQVITSAGAEGSTTVDIPAGDVGFSSFGCGTWARV
ncbi:MAG: hypothetical protein M3R01_06915 [Actinomycetota bacterium]|nr:hypothetical protein [Actinomycetota bacterium]